MPLYSFKLINTHLVSDFGVHAQRPSKPDSFYLRLRFAWKVRRPCGGRHGAHVHFSRPDHATEAVGEADGPHQNPEAGGRADEARPRISRQLVIGMAEPDEKANQAWTIYLLCDLVRPR
jgi:hypothetical protein